MKEKEYYKSDRAKMNLAGHRVRRLYRNYFEACHEKTSEPERLLFLPNPRSVHWLILFSLHNAKCAKDEFLSMLTLLPVVLLILFVFPYLLFLMKLKSSKVLFCFALPPPGAIILLKPLALSNAISNRTDWHFRKCGQSRWHLWHAHILLYFWKAN